MDQDLKKLFGRRILAADGELGRVQDFLFDAHASIIRYLVVDTGTWLSERQVLLPPHALLPNGFGGERERSESLEANVTREEIEESPTAQSHHLVSRSFEESYYAYFGWAPYWEGDRLWGSFDRPEPTQRPIPAVQSEPMRNQVSEGHLQRIRKILGFRLQTGDLAIGRICSATLNGYSWAIRDWVAQTGRWYARKRVFILPEHVERISDSSATVLVTPSREDFRRTGREAVVETGAQSMFAGEA